MLGSEIVRSGFILVEEACREIVRQERKHLRVRDVMWMRGKSMLSMLNGLMYLP